MKPNIYFSFLIALKQSSFKANFIGSFSSFRKQGLLRIGEKDQQLLNTGADSEVAPVTPTTEYSLIFKYESITFSWVRSYLSGQIRQTQEMFFL